MNNDKCKWIDGKFVGCEGVIKLVKKHGVGTLYEPFETLFGENVSFCPFCGADTRKPRQKEEKPVIKQGGKTWVKKEKGINFIWMGEYNTEPPELGGSKESFSLGTDNTYDSIEDWMIIEKHTILGDGISKCRPLVIDEYGNTAILYGVDPDGFLVLPQGLEDPDRWRLATVEDLKD